MMLDGWLAPPNAAEVYLDWCEKYLKDDEAFKTFKSNEDYFKTFDLNPLHGEIYKKEVESQYNFNPDDYLQLLERFKENDSVGSPEKVDYDGHLFSPPTLRYIKNSFFIKSHLNNQPINRILEVGAGYGGLCKTLDVILNFNEYYFVDLEPVVKVQQKYITQFECLKNKKFEFISTNSDDKVQDIDLFISNYSLSECNYDVQMKYFDQYIAQSKYVHIIYNEYTDNFDKFVGELNPNFDVYVTSDFNSKVIFAKRKR
jgi:hypothetical protein